MLHRFDVGPVLIQESFSIPDNCSALELEDLAAQHGSRLVRFVPLLASPLLQSEAGQLKFAGT